nr:mis18-binding protein 1-like [Lytechinus pictus]
MNPTQDSEKVVDGRKECGIRRPVPKYQHYIDHFEELYRQSPLAKVIDQNASSVPSKRNADSSFSGSAPGSFKVPLTSPVYKIKKPVPVSVGAFVMSPVAQLVQQMQSTAGVSQCKKRHGTASPIGKRLSSDSDRIQVGEQHDLEKSDLPQPECFQEVESPAELEAGVPSPGADDEEENVSLHEGENDEEGTEQMGEEEEDDTDMKGLGERRKSQRIKDKTDKSSSDVEHSNSGSCEDVVRKGKKSVTDLDQWIIKWIGSGFKHIAVEGHRLEDPEGSFWHSTAIVKRVSPCLVETSSGSQYRLHGNFNKLLALDQGFSKKLVHRFRKGFPGHWKACLKQEALEQSGGKKCLYSETRLAETAKNCRRTKVRLCIYLFSSNPASVVTPSYVSVEKVRTTKSGRKVLPPLQYWRGQRQRTLLYMDGAAELLEGSVDYTPVSATSLSVTGSIDISQRSRRRCIQKETPTGRVQAVKSTISKRKGIIKETESKKSQSKMIQKKTIVSRNERNWDTSKTKEDGEDCSHEAKSEKDSLQGSRRRSSESTNHQRSLSNPRSASLTAASDTVSPGSRVNGDHATTRHNQPYDLYGEVMGVLKENKQQRLSNQSRRRSQGNLSSSSAAEHSQGEESFNISDDEDFAKEESAFASEGEGKNASFSRKDSSAASSKSKASSKNRRRTSSRTNERVLLGSNMLPSVVLEKWENNDTNTKGKSKSSAQSQKQDKVKKQAKSKGMKQAPPVSRRSQRIHETNGNWMPDELQRLHSALNMIQPSSSQFWHRVAATVGTKTEWECQQQHQAKLEETTRKSNQSKNTKEPTKDKEAKDQRAKEPVALTAAKGTMKRKRQLRELIQQHNQASEEDLFDSTPFKKQRKKMKPLLNLDLGEEKLDDDDDGMMSKTPGSARLKTPSTRFHNLLAPLSGKKTPHSFAISPGLLSSVETKHIDQYIFGMQKKRASRRMKKVPATIPEIRSPVKAKSRKFRSEMIMPTTPTISEALQVDPVQDVDSEEEDADYYWSDEEESHSGQKQKKD